MSIWCRTVPCRALIMYGQSPPAYLICSPWTSWPPPQMSCLSMLQRAVHGLLLDHSVYVGGETRWSWHSAFSEKRVSSFSASSPSLSLRYSLAVVLITVETSQSWLCFNWFYFILVDFILVDFILVDFILFRFVLFYFILFRFILFYLILFNLILFWIIPYFKKSPSLLLFLPFSLFPLVVVLSTLLRAVHCFISFYSISFYSGLFYVLGGK